MNRPLDGDWWRRPTIGETAEGDILVVGNAPSEAVDSYLQPADYTVGINQAPGLASPLAKSRMNLRIVNEDSLLNPSWLRNSTPQILHTGRQHVLRTSLRQAAKCLDYTQDPPNVAWDPQIFVHDLGREIGLTSGIWPSSGVVGIQWARLVRTTQTIWIHGFSLAVPADYDGQYRRRGNSQVLDASFHDWRKEHAWLRSLILQHEVSVLRTR